MHIIFISGDVIEKLVNKIWPSYFSNKWTTF